MVNVHRYHQISEVDHRILNPLSDDDVARLGDICGLQAGQRHLDLASGKGEMLCQYARRHGTTGIGVDIFEPYVETARARALELGVDHAVEFVLEDASAYTAEPDSFDVVSCIGATWIGGGLPGTLRLMRPAVRDDGWMLVGEVFWNEEPTPRQPGFNTKTPQPTCCRSISRYWRRPASRVRRMSSASGSSELPASHLDTLSH